MRCNTQELHLARRRTLGHWHHLRFSSAQVRELRRAFRGTGRTRGFSVLTFQYDGRMLDMLENLTQTDSDRILDACKSMDLDVSVDDATAMNHDIARRGWFINPLRPDGDESHPINR